MRASVMKECPPLMAVFNERTCKAFLWPCDEPCAVTLEIPKMLATTWERLTTDRPFPLPIEVQVPEPQFAVWAALCALGVLWGLRRWGRRC